MNSLIETKHEPGPGLEYDEVMKQASLFPHNLPHYGGGDKGSIFYGGRHVKRSHDVFDNLWSAITRSVWCQFKLLGLHVCLENYLD